MLNLQVIEIGFDMWGVVFCCIFALTAYYSRDFDREGTKKLIWMLLVNAAGLFSDMIAWFFWKVENGSDMLITMAQIADFMAVCFNFTLMILTADYVVYLVRRRKNSDFRKWRAMVYAASILGVSALCLSRAYGFFALPALLKSNEAMLIIMSPNVFSLICLSLLGYFVVSESDWLTPIERIAFALYIVVPIVITATELYVYGYSPVNIGATTAIVLLFVSRAKINTEILVEQQKILNRQRLAEVEKQVRPHFIFNVLNIIYYLCASDSAKAQHAVETFSDYLRDNMKAMNAEELVPFSQELDYVKHYLSLEKLRYEDELTICYDIQCMDFKLPAFTVQPLAENAVKHGIRFKPSGGTVHISSWESDDAYSVRVADDGVGFDPKSVELPEDPKAGFERFSWLAAEASEQAQEAYFAKAPSASQMASQGKSPSASPDAGNGIGIVNTNTRLKLLCGGVMRITSAEGQGTTVDIHIPKEENNENHRS